MIGLILFVLLWLLSGAASFVYITTRWLRIDVTSDDIFLLILMSLFGPITFITGLTMYPYSTEEEPSILFRKKD